MKRQMTGGSHRGPLGLRRQRRTIRFTQLLLVALAAGLLLFAGYSWGKTSGYEVGRRADDIGAPRKPGAMQTVVLAVLGAASLAGALLLQGGAETVRIPTPVALDELAGRAEGAAIEKAERVAAEQASSESD